MNDARLKVELDGAVATITLTRPERLNAIDLDMLKALDRACDEIEANTAIHAAILTGEGKGFSAGGDIKAWGAMDPGQFGHQWVRYGHRVFDRLAALRVPLIAALNGHALGGGLELAACADIRIAEAQIRVGLPETTLGIVPGWSGTQRVVRRFGAQIVRRMLLGGEVFSAEEARALGLVDRVVETGGALAAAREQAEKAARGGPASVETAKLLIAVAEGEGADAAAEAIGSMLVAKTADLREGVAAFGGKRPARFGGDWS